jgi:hypothetical protein
MCDFFQPASSLQPPKQLEVPNPQSTTVAEGQYSGCEIACVRDSWSREIFDSSYKMKMDIRKMIKYFNNSAEC